jgi:hypothetical protein
VGAGQSGGGLFNEAWELIGMPLDTGPNGVYARPISAVLADLHNWKVPIGLIVRSIKDRARGADEIARETAAIALSRKVAALALSMGADQLDTALLLGAAAHETYPTPEARDALLTLLTERPYFDRYLRRKGGIGRLAFDQGRTLAVDDKDGFTAALIAIDVLAHRKEPLPARQLVL